MASVRIRGILMGGLAAAVAGGCVQVYQQPPQTAPAVTPAERADEKGDGEEDPFEPWEEVLEDTEAVDGYFRLHRKRDGAVLLEVPTARLGADFGLVMHYSRGVGDFNIQQGLPLSEARLMRIVRVADRLRLVHVNPRFTAPEGSRLARALETNVGHSVVSAFDILSEHDETGALLIDVTGFLASDYAGVSNQLSAYYGGQPVTLDPERSHVGGVQGFPRNVEIDAELTYRAGTPPLFSGGYGVSDWRSVPLGVRYSIFSLPEDPMTPRFGDDRVGYFLDALWDFSRDQERTPYLRYINRWRLEKADPSAELSEPVRPIVFYVDPSVPEPYRRYVKEGIEGWNKAFEEAGFRNAVEARDPPADDPTWSAEDVRYSTVRWTPSYSMGYAIGPSQTDPRTGEILNADILISYSFLTSWMRDWEEMVATPAGGLTAFPGSENALRGGGTGAREAGAAGGDLAKRLAAHEAAHRMHEALPPHLRGRLCLAAAGKAHQAAVGRTLLTGLGEWEADRMPEEYVGDAIRDLVMHEVGHTLGLRHNYKASSAIPHGRLNDEAFTRRHGLSLSVMDYAPVNVSPDRERQGHYWNKEVGSYDVWAIRYGYSVIHEGAASGALVTDGVPVTDPEAERPGLRKIASQAADPMHAYNTDEDAFLGPFSVDPLSNAWDLGSDPLAYARDRARLVGQVMPRLEERLIAEGQGYQRLRQATTSLIFERYVALTPIAKQVGGLHFARDHKGDPGARPPFRPVPADRQREAVRFLMEQAFAEDAWELDADLLNKLAPNRYSHWGTGFIALPVDYPLHSQVSLLQGVLLRDLLAPPRLWRLIDNEARMPPGVEAYPIEELFATTTSFVWSELGGAGQAARSVRSMRRNLQRLHLEHLGDLLLDRSGPGITASVPEDGRTLARRELTRLAGRMDALLAGQQGSGLDAMTRAHLEESRSRIGRLLEAGLHLEER